MRKQTIHVGLDVDGVLRDFAFQFTKYAKEIRGVDVEHEDYQTWGFPNVRDATGRKVIVDVFANPQVGEYVFQDAPPLENAYTGFRMFVENAKINTYIVSTQKKNYEIFTDKWLEKNNFSEGLQGVFYERNKLNAPVQMLIDDKPDNVIKFHQNKRDSILINRPYNRDVEIPESIPRVDDLIEAYQHVKRRYKRYL